MRGEAGTLGISATMLSGMGATRDSSIKTFRRVRKDFDNMHFMGLDKAGVDDDGSGVGDACEKRKVFAPFDSIPDGSQWEGLRHQNVTNAEGMGGTVAKVSY